MLLRYASESDRAGLANVNIGAFEGSLFLTNTFPQASPEGLRFFKGVMALRHLADPAVHVLVTVDDANAVLGYCRWKIPRGIGYDQEPVPLSQEGSASLEEPFRFAPRPMNEDMYNGFKRLMEETRKRHTTEDDFILDLLATLPEHQGKGIGSDFIKWGLEKADAMKRRAYLEATPEGYPLYCKYGWNPIEELTLDFGAYGGKGTQKFVVMMRDPQ